MSSLPTDWQSLADTPLKEPTDTHPSTLQQHRAPMVRPRRAPTRNQIGWNRCSSTVGEIVIAGALTGETGVRASSQAERAESE